MDIEEFMLAMGEDTLVRQIKKCFHMRITKRLSLSMQHFVFKFHFP